MNTEKDYEEKSKQLQATVENKSFTEQQLAELRLLTKKVGYQPHAWHCFHEIQL